MCDEDMESQQLVVKLQTDKRSVPRSSSVLNMNAHTRSPSRLQPLICLLSLISHLFFMAVWLSAFAPCSYTPLFLTGSPPLDLIAPSFLSVVYFIPPCQAFCWPPSPAATSGWSVSTVFTHCEPRVTQHTASDCTPAVAHLSCCEMEQGWREDRRYYGNSSYHCKGRINLEIFSLVISLCCH